MPDGEQDWIMKYRAALDAHPIAQPHSLLQSLTDLATAFAHRLRWIKKAQIGEANIPVAMKIAAIRKEHGAAADGSTLNLAKKAG